MMLNNPKAYKWVGMEGISCVSIFAFDIDGLWWDPWDTNSYKSKPPLKRCNEKWLFYPLDLWWDVFKERLFRLVVCYFSLFPLPLPIVWLNVFSLSWLCLWCTNCKGTNCLLIRRNPNLQSYVKEGSRRRHFKPQRSNSQ